MGGKEEDGRRVAGELISLPSSLSSQVVREVDVRVDKMERRVLALQKAADQHQVRFFRLSPSRALLVSPRAHSSLFPCFPFQTDVINIETAIRTKEGDPAREARTEAMGRCTEKIAQFRGDKREVEKRRNQARVRLSVRRRRRRRRRRARLTEASLCGTERSRGDEDESVWTRSRDQHR